MDIETFDRKVDVAGRFLACIGGILFLAVVVGFVFAGIGKFLIKQDTVVCVAAIAGFALTIVIAAIIGAITFFWRK